MKRFLPFLLLIISVFSYADGVQYGCVKTRGRMINGKHVPGKGLPGAKQYDETIQLEYQP